MNKFRIFEKDCYIEAISAIVPTKTKFRPEAQKGTSRWIVEDFFGKNLKQGEIVHHINFNRKDNFLDNLAIMTSKEHGQVHSSLDKIARCLFKKGIVVFNKEKNIYELNYKWKLLLK